MIARECTRLFVREDTPCKRLSVENQTVEGFDVEGDLQNAKYLLRWSYNPNRNNIDFHLKSLN